MDRERERKIEDEIAKLLKDPASILDIIADANLEIEIADYFIGKSPIMDDAHNIIRKRLLTETRKYAEHLVD